MKSIQIITSSFFVILSMSFTSCKSSSENEKTEDFSTETTENQTLDSYFEEEKVNIIDTMTFSLSEEDKQSILDFNNTKEPSQYYEFDENRLEKLEDLYAFYKGQEEFWWSRTSWAEKSKIISVNKLVEEISVNPSATDQQIKELKTYSEKLKTLFLNRDEIVDQNKIPFDDMTTALLDTIIKIGNSTPNMTNYQTYNLLVQDIDSLHNKAQLALRRTHIASIDSLNLFTSKNKTQLMKLGLKADSLTGWAY